MADHVPKMRLCVMINHQMESARTAFAISDSLVDAKTFVPAEAHTFQTDDERLEPIAERVIAGERLSVEDGMALYRSGDILAVGWLANLVRERLNGNVCYFNVNRHINPTNVCVAACRLCAFGRKKDSPGSYTMALEE